MDGKIDQAVVELAALNKKADRIIGILEKPENRFIKILETAGAIIAVLSVLSVIDIIRNWFGF